MDKTVKERRKAPLTTPTDLGDNARRDITGALNALLADVFALYLKTKNFHWHVSGPQFRDYHLLFDEQAEQIFAITDEAFIVLAANIFAVLGLRAAYFLIVGALDRFEYLHYGLAAVLAVVGLKMLTSEFYDPPVWMTLGAVVVILGTAILASLWATRNRERESEEAGASPPARTPVP